MSDAVRVPIRGLPVFGVCVCVAFLILDHRRWSDARDARHEAFLERVIQQRARLADEQGKTS